MYPILYEILELFYQKVRADILIGYHFYKFENKEVLDPHLKRITLFWEMQLTTKCSYELEGPPFRLLFTHLQLPIKKGEVNRWVIIFKQNFEEFEKAYLQKYPNIEAKQFMEVLKENWYLKILFFENKFLAQFK